MPVAKLSQGLVQLCVCFSWRCEWSVCIWHTPHPTLSFITKSSVDAPHIFLRGKNKAQRSRDLEDKLVNRVTRPLTRAASVVIDRRLYPGKNARSQMPGKDSVGCPCWGIIYWNNYFLLGTSLLLQVTLFLRFDAMWFSTAGGDDMAAFFCHSGLAPRCVFDDRLSVCFYLCPCPEMVSNNASNTGTSYLPGYVVYGCQCSLMLRISPVSLFAPRSHPEQVGSLK